MRPFPNKVLGAILAMMLAGPVLAGTLQDMINAAADGAEVVPPAGTYVENIVIDHNIVLDGRNGVVIDGGGEGTVVTLKTSGATLKNLTLQNSGRLFTETHAGLYVEGNYNVVRDVRIQNTLFGMNIKQSNNNVFRRVTIFTGAQPLEMRGDSIRVWYSNDNKFEDNDIQDARDFVIWYSANNIIRNNRIRNGRYGIHFMYAHSNTVEKNEITDCVVGIFMMYANNITLRDNQILRSWGASGIGVGFKESSGAKVYNNNIVGNAFGIYLDPSPWDPEHPNTFEGNRIAYNGVGIRFLNDWTGNNFSDNSFLSNFTQVLVNGRGTAMREGWNGNHWDDYAGFDKDRDGVGDVPYEIYNYADRLWMEVPHASFFRGGFALAALDFVERLAPFSEPRLLMRENTPLMEPPERITVQDAPKSALEMLQ